MYHAPGVSYSKSAAHRQLYVNGVDLTPAFPVHSKQLRVWFDICRQCFLSGPSFFAALCISKDKKG